MAAHTNVHITKSASGAYFENNWFWVSLPPPHPTPMFHTY
jgi:hypothetical protein